MWMLVLGLWGCDRDRTIAFPDGLAPIDMENTASWPADLAEAVNTTSGEEDPYIWAHARGYVHNGLDAIYVCMQDSEINLDRRQDTEFTRIDDVEEGYEHSYRLDILVHSILDVEFSDTWRHGSTRDDSDQPILTVSTWQMTEGNAYMTEKKSSVVAEVVEEGVVALDMISLQDVALPDEEQMMTYFSDLHAELIACASGEPLPVYD